MSNLNVASLQGRFDQTQQTARQAEAEEKLSQSGEEKLSQSDMHNTSKPMKL